MTIKNGEFQEQTADAILDAMIADAKKYWNAEGEELNDTELNVVETFYRPIASRLAAAQQDIGLVLQSTQIDNAEGVHLDLLTALIGVKRDKAEGASGYVTFSRDTPATSRYTVPEGTKVQTDASSPTVYKTTESTTIQKYDNFSDGDIIEYSGDTGSFTVNSDRLEAPATAGVEIHREDKTINAGADFQFSTEVGTNGISLTRFSYKDSNNYYEIVVDQSGRVALEVTDGGATSTVVEDTSVTVPSNAKVTVEVKWDRKGDFSVYFTEEATDNQFASLSGTDVTHESGGIGFKSGDANSKKYWDVFTSTAAVAPIESVEDGVENNTAKNTIVVIPDPPSGVEFVTNKYEVDGGSAKEEDSELRQRAKRELGGGSRASAPALFRSVKGLDGVTSVSIFIIDNDTDVENDGFELVVEGEDDETVAQTILDNMAAGDTSLGGINGSLTSASAEIGNGQSKTIDFSRPTIISIFVSADLTVETSFSGKDAVRDSIVDYIGGTFSTGNDSIGLGAGDDVIFGEIEYAIREVEGVYDVSNLTVDTSSTTGNTSNIAISDNEVATADATDSSLTFTTTQK